MMTVRKTGNHKGSHSKNKTSVIVDSDAGTTGPCEGDSVNGSQEEVKGCYSICGGHKWPLNVQSVQDKVGKAGIGTSSPKKCSEWESQSNTEKGDLQKR